MTVRHGVTTRTAHGSSSVRPISPATHEKTLDSGGTRIVIVADIRLYREGLALVLDRRNEFHVVATAGDRVSALDIVPRHAPEVVLMDMSTPESHAIVRELRKIAPRARVVALGIAEVEGDVLACAEAGVAGYVRRDGSLEELVAAIERAGRGEVACAEGLVASLWRRLSALAANQQPPPPPAELTRREREIVRLIDQDLSNKEIAKKLGIEVATVKNHIHNLLEKLGVHRRIEAARLASRVIHDTRTWSAQSASS